LMSQCPSFLPPVVDDPLVLDVPTLDPAASEALAAVPGFDILNLMMRELSLMMITVYRNLAKNQKFDQFRPV